MSQESLLKKSLAECVPQKNPLDRPFYIEAEVQAIRALFSRDADARQQRIVCDWLMRACGTHDEPFRPENQYLTAYACGKRFIGTTFVWMLKSAPTRTDPDKIAVREVGEQDG